MFGTRRGGGACRRCGPVLLADKGWEDMAEMNVPDFPGQFARTRRFTLGEPQDFAVSPDGERVLFVRSVSGDEPRRLLWVYEDGRERLLADPGAGPGPAADTAAVAEGVTGYATDREGLLAAYCAGGELWTVRTDGGEPRRIPTEGPVRDPRPSPDGSLVAYVTGGALRVVRADGTDDRALAGPEGEDVCHGLPEYSATASFGRTRGYWWSPRGDALLVARVDTAGVERRYLADPSDPGRPPRSVPYPAAGTANARVSLHVLALTGDRTPVRLPDRVPAAEAPAGGWGPDFEYVVRADWPAGGPLVALQSRDQRTLWVLGVDPATGGAEVLARRTDEAWVEFPPGAPLRTGAGTLVLPEVRGDVRSLRIGDVPAPDGQHVRAVLGAAGERVLFTASEDPAEVHVWSWTAADGFERLTSEPGVHTAAAGGGTLVLDSRTEDGRAVTVLRDGRPAGRIAVLTQAPLVKDRSVRLTLGARELRSRLFLPSWYGADGGPEGPVRTGKLPVLLNPYGGPGMQVVRRAAGWDGAVSQWFAEQGFAVLVTDGRGTPGRGVRWQREILGDRLAPVLEDQIDALHAAAERYGVLDLERVAVRGWSYGGYLAAGAVLRRPDVFHAAVAGAAPTDRRLYDTYWEERFLGHPDLAPDAYERSSLLPDAPGLARPLMLVHGLADDNVYPAHTLRLSAALLAAGRPHQVMLLPGVGHLVNRLGTADTLLRVQLAFLRTALGV